MSDQLQEALNNIDAAFNDAAEVIDADYPEIMELAREFFDSDETAVRYLVRPHPLYEGQTPVEVAAGSAEGFEQLKDQLARAEHGIAV